MDQKTLKSLSCPKCGAPLDLRDPLRARTIVCGSYGSHLSSAQSGLELLGKVDLAKHRPKSSIRLGRWANLEGDSFVVIGRIRYGGEAWNWDEWLLRSAKGKHLWLAEDGQRYTLFRTFQPKTPFPIDRLFPNSTVEIDGKQAKVDEVESVDVLFFEGELTWKATLGDSITYADFKVGQVHYSVEATDEEIRFFKGRVLSPKKIELMFGPPLDTGLAKGAVTEWRDYHPPSEGILPGVLWALFGVFIFYVLAIAPADAGGSRFPPKGSKRLTQGRHSVRRGSVLVRGYWGGFRRGK